MIRREVCGGPMSVCSPGDKDNGCLYLLLFQVFVTIYGIRHRYSIPVWGNTVSCLMATGPLSSDICERNVKLTKILIYSKMLDFISLILVRVLHRLVVMSPQINDKIDISGDL